MWTLTDLADEVGVSLDRARRLSAAGVLPTADVVVGGQPQWQPPDRPRLATPASSDGGGA